uniref:spore photoproduct lyase family protein n=1 Tax=Candidatus Electrothrix sp. TaxID=2170559 RepID=UPI0040575F87
MSYGDPAKYITQLYVTEECQQDTYAQEIIQRSKLPVRVIGDRQHPDISGTYPENLTQGKHHLLLCRNRGKFFKPCPATREYTCCEYQVLNIGMGCPMDCVYCILQAYLNNPWISFFVNINELFTELDAAFAAKPQTFLRIGTGEFTDSLALDSLTHFSPLLVKYMRDKQNAVLELKSKSVVIDNLEGLEHGGRTIVAWSLNSPLIMEQEEIRTASLEERLAAAVRCAEWGYRLAFHFDPIIWHKGWQEGYRTTIQRLFAKVPADCIAWISLGALRYLPALQPIAAERFPQSNFFYEEFVEGLDGKSRYFRSQRVEMYKLIVDELARFADPRTCIYFCMESENIWKEVFGYTPTERGSLPAMLDRSVCDMQEQPHAVALNL